MIKKTSATGAPSENLATRNKFVDNGIKNENMLDQELAEELHKSNITKFKKRKVHSCFIDNIWSADLPDMQLISKSNKGIRFFVMCHWYFQ